jgi:hypothetical protein
VGASQTDFAVSRLEAPPGRDPVFRMVELEDGGRRGVDVSVPLQVTPTSCPTVAPTRRGYAVAYQDGDGTFLADFDIQTAAVNDNLVVGSLRFGGPARQPGVAAVAAVGRELALLLARPGRAEVRRFDGAGVPKGGALPLPAVGSTSPLAAWPAAGALAATYLDAARTGGNQRTFVRVDCPLAPPDDPPPDADANDGK